MASRPTTKPRKTTPKYRFHKARNCAVVTINGRDHYLGTYDSPESCEKFHRLVAEHLAERREPPPPLPADAPLTVTELIARYWRFAKTYYVKDARPGLTRLGIYLYYLPPYSPELNRIEPVFKQVKHHEMPTRSFTTKADLRAAVEAGFQAYRSRLRPKVDTDVLFARDNSGEQPAAGTSDWNGFEMLTFDHLADPSEMDLLRV